MKTYKNLSKQSDIKAYQLYLDAIKIQFANEEIYLFTHENSGEKIIAKMKTLAAAGKGLGTYIQFIGNDSAQKLE